MGYDNSVPGIVKAKDGIKGWKWDGRLETWLQQRCKCPMLMETPKVVVELEFGGPNNQWVKQRNQQAENLG